MTKTPQDQPRKRAQSTVRPGTALHDLLIRFGLDADKGCKCKKRIKLMDQKGPAWCLEHIDTIVGWLQESARKRGVAARLLARPAILKRLVRRAIRDAGRAASAEVPVFTGSRQDEPPEKPKRSAAKTPQVSTREADADGRRRKPTPPEADRRRASLRRPLVERRPNGRLVLLDRVALSEASARRLLRSLAETLAEQTTAADKTPAGNP